MTTQTDAQIVTQLVLAPMDTTISDRAILLGLRRHYHFEVVGYGLPKEDSFYQGLNFVETVDVPPRGLGKVIYLLENDIPISRYLVIHEPKVAEEKKEEVRDFKKVPESIVPERDTSGEDVLKAVGAVLGALALGMGLMFLLALRFDPMLICVLDDPQKTWLMVESWYE